MLEAIDFYTEQEPKGECIIIVEGRTHQELIEEKQADYNAIPLIEHMEQYLSKGMSKKEAMKQVATDRGISKREVYQLLLEQE